MSRSPSPSLTAAPASTSRSPATSTRRIESSRWQAVVAVTKTPATATRTGIRAGDDRARRTLRTCSCPAPYPAAADRAGETPRSPRRPAPTARTDSATHTQGRVPPVRAASAGGAARRTATAGSGVVSARGGRRGRGDLRPWRRWRLWRFAAAAVPSRRRRRRRRRLRDRRRRRLRDGAARRRLRDRRRRRRLRDRRRRRRLRDRGRRRRRRLRDRRFRRLHRGDLRFDGGAVGRVRNLLEKLAVVVDRGVGVTDAAETLAAVEQHDRIVQQLVRLRVLVDRRLAVPFVRERVGALEVRLPFLVGSSRLVLAGLMAMVRLVLAVFVLLRFGERAAARGQAEAGGGERNPRPRRPRQGAPPGGALPAPSRRT